LSSPFHILQMAFRSFFVAIALLVLNSGSVTGSTVPEGSIGRRKAGDTQAVFPVAYQSGWTTSTSSFPNVRNLPLRDDALGVNRVSGGTFNNASKPSHNTHCTIGTSHNVVQINGRTAWEALYPKGSMNPSSNIRGGFGFYLDGPDSWNIEAAREVTFSYAVMFQNDFKWQKGGKLPGLCMNISSLAIVSLLTRGSWRYRRSRLRLLWRTQGESGQVL
jgi:hypothetical protein